LVEIGGPVATSKLYCSGFPSKRLATVTTASFCFSLLRFMLSARCVRTKRLELSIGGDWWTSGH
jgi:hypothetical protein